MKRKAISISLVLVLLLTMSACTGPKVVKVGVIGDFSGRGAELCVPIRDAMFLLADEYNANQQDYEVQIVAKDHQGDVDQASEVLSEFIEEGIELVVGPMLSTIAYENYDFMTSGELLFISPTVSTVSLEGVDDYLIRVIPTNATQGRNLGEYAITVESNDKAGILFEATNIEFTYYLAEGFKTVYENHGGEVVYFNEFETGSTQDLEALALEIAESGAEDLLLVSNSLDVAYLCQYLEANQVNANIYTAVWANQASLFEMGGSAVNGLYVLGAFDEALTTDAYKAFQARYFERYQKEMTMTAGYAYDATAILFEMLEAGVYEDIDTMKETILEISEFEDFSQSFSIDEYGDANRDFTLYQIVEGNLVKVD